MQYHNITANCQSRNDRLIPYEHTTQSAIIYNEKYLFQNSSLRNQANFDARRYEIHGHLSSGALEIGDEILSLRLLLEAGKHHLRTRNVLLRVL